MKLEISIELFAVTVYSERAGELLEAFIYASPEAANARFDELLCRLPPGTQVSVRGPFELGDDLTCARVTRIH